MKGKAKCPVCFYESEKKRSMIQHLGKYERHFCPGCGTIYIYPGDFPLPTYNAEYNKHFRRPTDIYKAGLYTQKIANMLGYPDTSKNFIEVGSGNAYIPFLLQDMGYNTFVLDCAPDWCQYIHDKYHIKALCGYVEDFSMKIKFDFVYCSHVIEHSENPLVFMKKLKDLCKEKGRIFLSTPDTYYYEKYKLAWKHLKTRDPFEHCCLMSRIGMEKILHALNIKIVQFTRLEKYTNMEYILEV